MPPLVKINHRTPLIAFNANAGPRLSGENSNFFAGRWEFTDHFCGFFDTDFWLGIGQLSQSLTTLRSYMSFTLPPDVQIIDVFNTQHNQILNCFAPDAVDSLAAAILHGNEIEFAEIFNSDEHNQYAAIEVKDKSWLLINKYSYQNCYSPEHCGKVLSPLSSGLVFRIDLFTLALLCKQHKITRQLLPSYLETLPGQSIFNISYYELILKFDPDLFTLCLADKPKNATIFLCDFIHKQQNKLIISTAIKNSCDLDLDTIVSLFASSEVIAQIDNNRSLSIWLSTAKIDPNCVINTNGETLIFLLFAAKAFNLCEILLKNYPAIDLNLRNNLGQKCFELLSDIELLSHPDLLQAILQNITSKKACNFIQDKSTILQELHIQPDYLSQNFKILVTANPRLLQNKNYANNYCFEYLIENKRNGLDILAFIRDINPQVFTEVAVKHNKFILSFADYVDNQESDNDINTLPMEYKKAALDAAKKYLKVHAENAIVTKHSPELLLHIESELNPPLNTGSKYKCIIS